MPTSFVRLTKNEFNQLKTLSSNQLFQHINLQHYGIPKDILEATEFKAVEILKHGIIGKKGPILELNNPVELELIDIKCDIRVSNLLDYLNLELPILLNKEGDIKNSLYSKYTRVLGEKKSNIEQMYCYIRSFKILA